MANSLVYHKFKLRQMGNNGTVVDLDADTIKLMLMNATYAAIADATKQTHEFYSDVSGNEVSGTGYTARATPSPTRPAPRRRGPASTPSTTRWTRPGPRRPSRRAVPSCSKTRA
jgi:hypothetical protein